MKKVLIVVCVMVCYATLSWGMGFKPEPPVVTEPVVPATPVVIQLTGYTWEDSDDVLGKSYVSLPAGMQAASVIIDGFAFVYKQTWHNNSQLWYGPLVSTFDMPATIIVTNTAGTVYSTDATGGTIEPSAPVVTPPVVTVPPVTGAEALENYVWEDSDSVIGKSYVMLAVGMQAVSVKINAVTFVYKQTWHTGRQLWYGPTVSNFNKTAEIVVKDIHGKVYSSKVTTPSSSTTVPSGAEKLRYNGRANGDRPTWYGSKNMNQYKSCITVQIDGCMTRTITHNGKRYDSAGLIVKQSDVSGRGLAVVYSSSCKSKTAYITE